MRLRLQWVLAVLSLTFFGWGLITMLSVEDVPFEEWNEDDHIAEWISNLVELSEEEIAIYNDVLDQWAGVSDYPRGRVVTSKLRAGFLFYQDGVLLNDPVEYETVSKEMARSFMEARKIPACISQIDVMPPFGVRGEEYCKTGNNKPPQLDLEEIYRTGPVHSFSRIGFNKNRDRAVLAYDYHCGPLCGFAGTMTLRKATGKWQVDGVYMEMIS